MQETHCRNLLGFQRLFCEATPNRIGYCPRLKSPGLLRVSIESQFIAEPRTRLSFLFKEIPLDWKSAGLLPRPVLIDQNIYPNPKIRASPKRKQSILFLINELLDRAEYESGNASLSISNEISPDRVQAPQNNFRTIRLAHLNRVTRFRGALKIQVFFELPVGMTTVLDGFHSNSGRNHEVGQLTRVHAPLVNRLNSSIFRRVDALRTRNDSKL